MGKEEPRNRPLREHQGKAKDNPIKRRPERLNLHVEIMLLKIRVMEFQCEESAIANDQVWYPIDRKLASPNTLWRYSLDTYFTKIKTFILPIG